MNQLQIHQPTSLRAPTLWVFPPIISNIIENGFVYPYPFNFLKFYLFTYGCAGSSLLHTGFLFGGNHKTQLWDKKASVSGELYHVHRLENNIIKRSALPLWHISSVPSQLKPQWTVLQNPALGLLLGEGRVVVRTGHSFWGSAVFEWGGAVGSFSGETGPLPLGL